MKKFIKRFIGFLLFAVIISLLFITYVRFDISHQLLNHEEIRSKNILVMGDSHTEYGINPDVLTNSLNVSTRGEHYFYSYSKLKLILDNCPNFKHVILATGTHNFAVKQDGLLFDENVNMDMYKKYFQIIETGEIFKLFGKDPLAMTRRIPYGVVGSMEDCIKKDISDYSFFGGYFLDEREDPELETTENTVGRHYYKDRVIKDENLLSFSGLQVEYLSKIITLCNTNNIKIYLLSTPVHPRYKELIPDVYENHYQSILEHHSKNITVLDFRDYKLDEEYFGDEDHLNKKGAIEFSKRLSIDLRNLQQR